MSLTGFLFTFAGCFATWFTTEPAWLGHEFDFSPTLHHKYGCYVGIAIELLAASTFAGSIDGLSSPSNFAHASGS